MASRAASVLRGKHRPDFTPHQDTGDFVVIINAAKVKLTGAKADDKLYHRHTGYPGGIRTHHGRQDAAKTKPERLIEMAVRGMLPKNRLGRRLFTKLKVYRGGEHPHAGAKARTNQVIDAERDSRNRQDSEMAEEEHHQNDRTAQNRRRQCPPDAWLAAR